LRILLDEGVPDIVQARLSDLAIFSVKEMASRGLKNGALLEGMGDDFQILLTTDKNLPFQQNLKKRKISVIILPANDVPSVIELLPRIRRAIDEISPGEFIQIRI